MEAGYKPWLEPDVFDGQLKRRSKRDAHRPNHLQACVRMLRADYCGDGTSHTVRGRRVEFWDSMGLHEQTQSRWSTEGSWSPDGVECLGSPRVAFANDRPPSCVRNKLYAGSSRVPNVHQTARRHYERWNDHIFNTFEHQLRTGRHSRTTGSSYGGNDDDEEDIDQLAPDAA